MAGPPTENARSVFGYGRRAVTATGVLGAVLVPALVWGMFQIGGAVMREGDPGVPAATTSPSPSLSGDPAATESAPVPPEPTASSTSSPGQDPTATATPEPGEPTAGEPTAGPTTPDRDSDPKDTTTSEPPREDVVHLVAWGETLTSISQDYGVGIQDLLNANPQIVNADLIYAESDMLVAYSVINIPKVPRAGD